MRDLHYTSKNPLDKDNYLWKFVGQTIRNGNRQEPMMKYQSIWQDSLKDAQQALQSFITCAVKLARSGAGYKAPARQCGLP